MKHTASCLQPMTGCIISHILNKTQKNFVTMHPYFYMHGYEIQNIDTIMLF